MFTCCHVDFLAYRENVFEERTDKSTIYDVKRFETFQWYFSEWLFLTTEHLVYSRECLAIWSQAQRICPLRQQINFWNRLTFLKSSDVPRSSEEPFSWSSVKISGCRVFSLFETVPGCRAFSHSVKLLTFLFFCMQVVRD